jgi:hypothetical protein
LAPDELRRIGGEQEIIARYAPDKAVETLSVLVVEPKDRDRLLTLLERVLADRRVQLIQPSAAQRAMLPVSAACSAQWSRRPAGSRRGSRLIPGKARVRIAKPRVTLAKKSAGAA